jgi:hypothetical protein
MATIPDPASIERRIPSGREQLSGYRDPGAGQFEADISSLLDGVADQRTKSSLAKAENQFLLAKAEEDNAYDEDTDYATIEGRWTKNVSGKLNDAASIISNPILRDEFINRQKIRVEEGRQRMEGFAREKEYDFERADLSRRLEDTVNVGIEGGDFMTAYKSATNLIDTNIALSEEQRQKLKQSTRIRIATGRLDVLPPEKRMNEIERLEDHLPKDVIAKYKRHAEEALIDQRTQTAVDSVMSQEATMEERRNVLDKQFKNDTKARDEANRRLDYRLAKEKEAKVEQQMDLHGQYFLDVREGRIQVADIPLAEREAMGPNMIKSLYSAQDARTSAKAVESDRQTLLDLHRMNESNDPNVKVRMQEYFIENADKLNATDYNNWARQVAKDEAPSEVKSMLTTQQTILSKFAHQAVDGYDYSTNDKQLMLENLNQWHVDYQRTHNGKLPTDQERDAKIDQLLMRFPTSGWWFGSDEMSLFKMTDNDLGAAMTQARERNDDAFSKAVEYVTAQEGLDPTSLKGKRRILQAYKVLSGRGEQ